MGNFTVEEKKPSYSAKSCGIDRVPNTLNNDNDARVSVSI